MVSITNIYMQPNRSSATKQPLKVPKQQTKFMTAKFCKNKIVMFCEFKEYKANSVDLYEATIQDTPNMDLPCLQSQIFTFLEYLLKSPIVNHWNLM